MTERIGFIGLGIMGKGMASNLVRAGFDVCVWNRTASRTEPVVALGATQAATPAEVARQSDIVITCVSDTPDVEAVILGDDGVLAGAREGMLVIDMSTISPQATRTISQRLGERGVQMLDAPVSGGSEGATKGTLSIMVGGAAADVERAMPAFPGHGQRRSHMSARQARDRPSSWLIRCWWWVTAWRCARRCCWHRRVASISTRRFRPWLLARRVAGC